MGSRSETIHLLSVVGFGVFWHSQNERFCEAKSSEYTINLIVARRRHRNAIPRLAGWTPERGGGSMANYAIMRCKKLTGMGSVASALQHC
ncbi:hypothetical protein LCT52_25185, partial [Escherichia coli]|nr:hypothetical protein [Escherichia coli]